MTSEERELNKQVAELMGLRLFEHRKKFYCVPQVDGGDNWDNAFFGPWNPCGRPDYWWKVVKRVREQDERFRAAFMQHLLNNWIGTSELVKAPIVWFLLEANPGVPICRAFIKAMADD